MTIGRKLIAAIAATVVATALVASASARPTAEMGTIVDVASSNKSFSTLVTLVQAGGLVEALSGETKLTVFAPTNAAFKALEREVPGVTKALTDPKNRGLLVQVLKYHVVAGEVDSTAAIAAAKKKAKVPTLLGKSFAGRVSLSLAGGKLKVADSAGIHKATVTKADVGASNGVIHVVDKVLIPKQVAAALKKAGLI
ncbi:MAG: fasciclin domain-containing protein [Gaiellales bacterium]